MADLYPYLIASLPELQFGARPAFSFERLIEMCHNMIPPEDEALVKSCATDAYLEEDINDPTLLQWRIFETGLRNELVMVRAGRKKADAQKYLRRNPDPKEQLFHIAMTSHRMTSFIESEKFLDRERWRKLDELALGHYFDCPALIVYALKMRILLRWDAIESADKQATLERILV